MSDFSFLPILMLMWQLQVPLTILAKPHPEFIICCKENREVEKYSRQWLLFTELMREYKELLMQN